MSILGRLIRFFTLIDLQALSGVNRMLGVTIDEGRVRVAEVVRKGNPFRKLSARFEVAAGMEVQMAQEVPPEETGKKLALALRNRGIRTKSAVVGLRMQGIRSVDATLPQGARDTDRWIRERMPELLKLPVAEGQFQFRHRKGEGGNLRITFSRTSEIDFAGKVLQEAGLSLFAVLPESDVDRPEVRALLPAPPDTETFLTGHLAIAGFLPDLIQANFLSMAECEARDTGTAKHLFHRVALLTGTLILILLGSETVASRWLAGELAVLNERNASLQSRMEGVEELEGEVSTLEARLGDRSSTLTRTDVSRILHTVATAAPKDLRFARVRLQEGEKIVLSGFAEREEAVTRLLKSLTGAFADVRVIRLGTPRERASTRNRCEFEIRMSRKDIK